MSELEVHDAFGLGGLLAMPARPTRSCTTSPSTTRPVRSPRPSGTAGSLRRSMLRVGALASAALLLGERAQAIQARVRRGGELGGARLHRFTATVRGARRRRVPRLSLLWTAHDFLPLPASVPTRDRLLLCLPAALRALVATLGAILARSIVTARLAGPTSAGLSALLGSCRARRALTGALPLSGRGLDPFRPAAPPRRPLPGERHHVEIHLPALHVHARQPHRQRLAHLDPPPVWPDQRAHHQPVPGTEVVGPYQPLHVLDIQLDEEPEVGE